MTAKICERPGCGELRVVTTNPRSRWLALTDEHDHLLNQLACKVDAVLAAAGFDQWPASELHSLVVFLNNEVLPQAAREEQDLLTEHAGASQIAQLNRDHDRLRAGTAVLARAEAGEGSNSPADLAATARSVLAQFRRHLLTEAELLAPPETLG